MDRIVDSGVTGRRSRRELLDEIGRRLVHGVGDGVGVVAGGISRHDADALGSDRRLHDGDDHRGVHLLGEPLKRDTGSVTGR